MNLNPKDVVENIHDSTWRLNNLYFIRDKKGKKVLFKMNDTQCVLHADKSQYTMALKGRQQGVSTYYLLKYFDQVLWSDNQNVVILSHDRSSLKKLFRIVRFAYEAIPEWLKPKISRGGGSANEMFFPVLNSRISVTLEARSESITHLHVSEYGFMQKSRFDASTEAVPLESGFISIESTANGMNHFHDDYFDSAFPYSKHFFPWFFHRENNVKTDAEINLSEEELKLSEWAKEKYSIKLTKEQIAWRRFKIKQNGDAKFFQEHPENERHCFLTSGNKVMDLEIISDMIINAVDPLSNEDGFKIFEEHDRDKRYVIGADTAEGVGSDYSVAVVLEKKTKRNVATLRGHFPPKQFAEKIVELAKLYSGPRNEPLVSVERNNHGHAVLLWLDSTLGYMNLYKHTDDKLGWSTNGVTRPVMIDTFIDAIHNGFFITSDKDILGECMTLVDNNGKIEAMKGKHDDTIIASAIALQAITSQNNYLEDLMNM